MKWRSGLIILGLFMTRITHADPVWPAMREFELSMGISFLSHRNDVEVPLYDVEGRIRYRFICRGDDREVDEATARRLREQGQDVRGDSLVPWWPLTCVLIPEGGRTNLLDSDGSNGPYQTRGRIAGEDLVGACADYPEYGRVRHFRLRGFELTVSFSDIEPSSPKPDRAEYAIMHLALKRRPKARTAWAEQSGYLSPRRAAYLFHERRCMKVHRGNEQRMCRNAASFSWEECMAGSEFEPAMEEITPYAVDRQTPARKDARKRILRLWFEERHGKPDWPSVLVEERVALVREAARRKDGKVMGAVLPVFPFVLLCGKAGTPRWSSVRVDDMKTWRRLWRVMLKQKVLANLAKLTMAEVHLSPRYGIWIRGGVFRFQDGLTVATEISCDTLKRGGR